VKNEEKGVQVQVQVQVRARRWSDGLLQLKLQLFNTLARLTEVLQAVTTDNGSDLR
jgi:hypothetical protein